MSRYEDGWLSQDGPGWDHPPGRPWRVLTVDDDADVHCLLETVMELDGRFEVVAQAHDGNRALEEARRHRPDCVVLDLSMPGIDGWAALPELRRMLPRAVIVVFSAYPDPLTLFQVLAAGADGYLDKATTWEVIPVLAELLGQRQGPAGIRPPAGVPAG